MTNWRRLQVSSRSHRRRYRPRHRASSTSTSWSAAHSPPGRRYRTYLSDSIIDTLKFELACIPSATTFALGLVVGGGLS